MHALRESALMRGLLGFIEVLSIVFLAAYIQNVSQPAFAISPMTICSAATEAEFPGERSYLAENEVAMNKMMSGMVVKPTGDVDRDFVSMMSPHHLGAIEMAQAVLRKGHNEQIRRLAQEIIVTQQQEIVAMRLAIGGPLPPSVPSPTQISGTAVQP
jgi:uncharacterized protein (DUF305 family)